MNKLVLLNIDEGSFEEGFPVRLGIGEDGRIHYRERVALNPAPNIPQLYQEWQDKYRNLGETIRQIGIPPAQITNISVIEDENQARNIFEEYLHRWFAQLPWRELRVRIEERTQPNDLIRIIIDTNNIYLKKLPWHLWQLFHNRPHAEFALSAEYAPPKEPLKRPVKILAIFGGSEGLDLDSDRELITNLRSRGAKVTWLEKPQRSELSESLWDRHWDILFFAGHSSSGEEFKTGEIQINDSESISLTRLKNSLKTAVKNGLKLAIFNSCDGLGLADELIGVKVPQMIVMREPVPDEVARQFLKYFLEDFSKGNSLYLAVRNARHRLEWMEDHFPCASWLPVICQNPAARPLVWAKNTISVKRIASVAGVFLGAFLGYQIFTAIKFPEPTVLTDKVIADSPKELDKNFSWGEKILIYSNSNSNSNSNKDAGIKAFANKQFDRASEYFQKSLDEQPNDPETLIYLNNAVAKASSKINLLPVPKSLKLKSNLNACSLQNNPNQLLKIAVTVPINLDSNIALELLRGVAQVQNEINCKGGINGRLLQVMIVDDQDDVSVVKKIAQQLVEIKDILAIVGHYSSNSTLEADKIYNGKIVAVSPTSGALRKSNNNPKGLELSQWVFRVYPTDARRLVDYMVDTKGYKKATIVYDPNREWSKSIYQEFTSYLEKSKGGKVVNICKLDGTFNANNCVENANKKNATVMVLFPEFNQNGDSKAFKIFDASKRFNKLLFLATSTMYTTDLLNREELAEKMVISMSWHRNKDNPSQFESDALELWNAQINVRSAMSYDATMAIVKGLQLMDNNPTRERMQKVLSAADFWAEGASAKVEFENGDRKELLQAVSKITPENNAQIGALVQVKCDNQTLQPSCEFVRIPQ